MKYLYRYSIIFFTCFLFIVSSCKDSEKSKNENAEDSEQLTFKNPVLPGDFADPSVVRVGEDYWATATSSEWAPLFPIIHSENLQDWEIKGHVFPENLPQWAEAHFWAPEIAYDNDKYYIYYTAKKEDGPLCVGVASADEAEGPYEDHGPIVCQEAGAIDGFQIRDDEGKLFLIWKEDGNSRGEPTPMWGQEMNEERTELVGERFELFRNDPDTWEGNLVEGAYLLKKNGYYYTFYSGDACCGRGCTYGIGVARAKDIQGPWEKYEENPLKRENEDWKCAGHGSLVQDEEGRYFFLYHAYNKEGSVYTGRQGLISEVIWNKETGWPEFKDESANYKELEAPEIAETNEDFSSSNLSPYWQWSVGMKPDFTIDSGSLILEASNEKIGSVLAQRSLTPNYEATTIVNIPPDNLEVGISAIGDVNNALGLSIKNQEIFVWKLRNAEKEILLREHLVQAKGEIELKISVNSGDKYSFSWRKDGNSWQQFDKEESQVEGDYLPPWDRAVRVGLLAKGDEGLEAFYHEFFIKN